MEAYFSKFRKHIIGIDQTIDTPYGKGKKIVYADWTASGRNYRPIEERIIHKIMPLVGNTHTETSATGMAMTYAYHQAQSIIKTHVNAGPDDVIITCSSGMTGVVNKLQRILGLKLHESYRDKLVIAEEDRPVIFITHMEHHSNQTSWLETIADVKIIEPTEDGMVSLEHFKELLYRYRARKIKIAAVTSCSNVTGIFTPYREIAKLIHAQDGFCFADFACSAPYVDIDMHPDREGGHLDAIYFSPHKFLGGPGASGVLIFNRNLYKNTVPDDPGGGTVDWTNPWGQHKFVDDIEAREDGGTPAFLQTIKAAMCIQLKEEMGTENILNREKEQLEILWEGLAAIPEVRILAGQHKDRLGVISFYIEDLHYNVGVRLLNDKFGIQVRGGCSCAGTYGHYLLNVEQDRSNSITTRISQGDCSTKPGWIRLSIHPTLTDEELRYMIASIKELVAHHREWTDDYTVNYINNIIRHSDSSGDDFIKASVRESLSGSLA